MSILLERTTNSGLHPEPTRTSAFDEQLQSSISIRIASAIFTSDRSTNVVAERYKRHFLAALSMTTSGVELELTIPSEFGRVAHEIETTALPIKSTQQAVNELRKLSGLTWEQLAILFDVSRRSVHFWASGQPLTSANEEKLNRILDVVEYISRSSASRNRSLLMGIADDGKSYLDLLAAGEYDRVKSILGAGNAPKKPNLGHLSQAAEMARMPPNPADLVDALQDSVHHEVGKSRAAKSVRSRN